MPRTRGNELTENQENTLEFIIQFKSEHGVPPTIREIGRRFGIKSSSAHARVQSLKRKGYVRKGNLGARSLIIENPKQECDRNTMSRIDISSQTRDTLDLQPPFRYQDLLPTTAFVGYCSERGVHLHHYEKLEYYERMNLLLPAIKIDRGAIEKDRRLKKIYRDAIIESTPMNDINSTYVRATFAPNSTDFKIGALSPGDGDWLGTYREQQFSAQLRKSKRIRDKGTNHVGKIMGFEPSSDQERFYVRHQVFAVRYIQNKLKVTIADEQLFQEEEMWRAYGRQAREQSGFMLYHIGEGIKHYYTTFALLNDVRDLIDEMFEKAKKKYDDSYKDDRNVKEAIIDVGYCIKYMEKEYIPGKAKSILDKSGLILEDIARRREEIILEGRILDPIPHWFPYINPILPRVFDKFAGEFKLAMDCYTIAKQLGWFLQMLGHKTESLGEAIMGRENISICPYCSELFQPIRKTQKTCGKKRCSQDNKNTYKRLRAKMGL